MKNEEKLYNCYLKIRKVLHDNDGEFIKEDNEFYWGIILNSKLSFEEKEKELKNFKQNVKIIINPLVKIKHFIKTIEEFKEKDEIIFEKEPFYSFLLEIKYANNYQKIKNLKRQGNTMKKL